MSLNSISKRFGVTYRRNKEFGQEKDQWQKKLFEAFDEALQNTSLQHCIVNIPDDQDKDKWIAQYHPGWLWESEQDGHHILIQDPTKMAYTHINPDDGMVYGRDAIDGTPSLDDERLKEENPEFWDQITEWPEPWYSLVKGVFEIHHHGVASGDEIEKLVEAYLTKRGVLPVLRDIASLSESELAVLEDYLMPGPISVRLRPPRKAKEEELG